MTVLSRPFRENYDEFATLGWFDKPTGGGISEFRLGQTGSGSSEGEGQAGDARQACANGLSGGCPRRRGSRLMRRRCDKTATAGFLFRGKAAERERERRGESWPEEQWVQCGCEEVRRDSKDAKS